MEHLVNYVKHSIEQAEQRMLEAYGEGKELQEYFYWRGYKAACKQIQTFLKLEGEPNGNSNSTRTS